MRNKRVRFIVTTLLGAALLAASGYAQGPRSPLIQTPGLKVAALGPSNGEYDFVVTDPVAPDTVLGTGSLALSDKGLRFNLQDANGLLIRVKGTAPDGKSAALTIQAGQYSSQLVVNVTEGAVLAAPAPGSADAVRDEAAKSRAMGQLLDQLGHGKSLNGASTVGGLLQHVVRLFQKPARSSVHPNGIYSCGDFAREDLNNCMYYVDDPLYCFWHAVLIYIFCVL